VAELWEEVTRARAAAVMAETCATRAEKMAQEGVVLLAIVCSEADEAAQRVFVLEGELMAACQAQDVAEGKFLSLSAQVAVAEWQRVAAEEQCEHLVHELTFSSLRGSELCMTITGARRQCPYTRECGLR
jgi:hypothetical protein